jgi:hypothetical protein
MSITRISIFPYKYTKQAGQVAKPFYEHVDFCIVVVDISRQIYWLVLKMIKNNLDLALDNCPATSH